MASFQATGFISSIKYQHDFCLVFIDEFKKGFRKKDGTIVADKYMQWKCIFKKGLVKYINDHFSNGMLVEVKGEVFPYAVEHDTTVDGYSVIGQTINMASFPRASARQEAAMIKDSQLHVNDIPNMDEYNKPDF
jgi:hypothetical protein